MHQNLRANVSRLFFAGEATSAEYYGFLHGAYFEGQAVGRQIAGCVRDGVASAACGGEGNAYYPGLMGTTPLSQLIPENGWTVSSFLNYAV